MLCCREDLKVFLQRVLLTMVESMRDNMAKSMDYMVESMDYSVESRRDYMVESMDYMVESMRVRLAV
jgi:hypothetical protein